MDWGDPFNSIAQNVGSGATDVGKAVENSFQPGRAGQAILSGSAFGLAGLPGVMGNQNSADGGNNWFGYMPENLQGFDQILNQIMTGKGGTNPYMQSLQANAANSFTSAAGDRGTNNAGFSAPLQARYMTDTYNNAQNQQMQDIMQYLNIAQPRALTPQSQGPSTEDNLFNLAGKVGPALIAAS